MTSVPSSCGWMSGLRRVSLIAEFADDLFENVLERDDAANVAILVHDDADPALLFLEVQQLGGKRRVFRHK